MKKTIWQWLVFLSLGLAFMAPREVFGGACTCARFNDFKACGCRKTPGVPGGPPSGAVNSTGNNAHCEPCEGATGMPRWWVDEPYINLHVVDEPLSYTTSSGQEMAFRFNYRQRFSFPGLDQLPSQVIPGEAWPVENRILADYYANTMHEAAPYPTAVNPSGMTNAAWSHNWMMHIVMWDWYSERYDGNYYAFQSHYEALVFTPDGGISYYTYGATNQTLNSPTQLTNSVSQTQLILSQPFSWTNAPVPDSNGIYWGSTTNGVTLVYPDGSKDVFGLLNISPFSGTTTDALLTQRIDPQGRVTQLGYQAVVITTPWGGADSVAYNYFRLLYVVDADGRTTTFNYISGAANPWLLQNIQDPFGRTATFTYNQSNWLASITDAAGNSNSFAYVPNSSYTGAPSGWLQSLTTPYGTTSFSYFQGMDGTNSSNYVERVVLVSEPESAHQLFAYIHNLSGIIEASTNSPTVPFFRQGGNFVFDDGTTGTNDPALYHRNSFHWDRNQFENLSSRPSTANALTNSLSPADFQKASMKHWLLGTDNISITETLSSTRDPSPDTAGGIRGQWNLVRLR